MAWGRWRWVCSAALLTSLLSCGPRAVPSWTVQRDRLRADRLNEAGLALVVDGRFDEAEATFRQALEADPFFGPAHSNLGVTLLQQGKFYEAGWELRHACQLMPKASQPRANLGILYETVGRYGEAEEHLRAALRLSPDDIEIIGHLARVNVRQSKHTPETLAWLQTIATQDDHPVWRSWAGEQLARNRNADSQAGR
jgi:Flp pilus assembly protein TadD